MTKQYDRQYFDKWYRRRRINTHAEVRRKVMLALTVCEYFLRRPLRSVLDIGCGEGAWYPHLRTVRRNVEYVGIDSSHYALERFGESRNIRRGTFGELRKVRGKFDLVVCADVMHYLSIAEIRAGLPELVRLTDGLAFVEVLTSDDEIVGDLDEIQRRSTEWYLLQFARAGLTWVAPYSWLSKSLRDGAAELEAFRTS